MKGRGKKGRKEKPSERISKTIKRLTTSGEMDLMEIELEARGNAGKEGGGSLGEKRAELVMEVLLE